MTVGLVDDMSSLVHAVRPIPGEGLGELLLRAAAENGYDKTDWILALAGRKGSFLSKTLRLAPEELVHLARVLGLDDPAGVGPLLYKEVAGMKGWLDFFGAPVRARHLQLRRRRVSPRSLRQSPHLKAVWAVRIFSFDPETKEQLIDRCPVCGVKFNFWRVLEPWSCASCLRTDHEGFRRPSVDLRDYPQPVVEVADQMALDFVTGLVQPDPERRSDCAGLHPGLQALSRGELFEMVVSLCCAVIPEPGESPNALWRPMTNEDYRRVTPDLLAKMGRTILSWPEGFHQLASEVRERSDERPGHYGVRKELGPLLRVTGYKNVPKAVRDLVRKAIDDDMAMTASALPTVRRSADRYRADLMTIADAHAELGCTGKHMTRLGRRPEIEMIQSAGSHGPILFRRDQIETILRQKDRIVASQEVVNRLGISRSGLRQLAEKGLLERETGAVIDIMIGNDYYLAKSVDDLLDRIVALVRNDECPEMHVRLRKAVNRLPERPADLWPTIIENILGGRLPIWLREGRLAALTSRIAVEHIAILTDILQTPGQSRGALVLNQAEAAQVLGIGPLNVNQLVAAGFLPRKMVQKDLDEFARTYVLTNGVLELLKERGRVASTKVLVGVLRAAGLKPATELLLTGRPVWVLREIVRFLDGGGLSHFKLLQSR
ncbi:hypothetical protein E2F50_03775 [Rhizobium deserti]|uniref:TniQ family protein n=1 Tax=Rhizobium deserti TaxID=2547961 RepID=A0A4R5UMX8_9HYPH|nr:hypothetical protein [Rhizobium deserti]TDK39252.1 hypothetical protein E2F50_03775 [Rhizobium deserti]